MRELPPRQVAVLTEAGRILLAEHRDDEALERALIRALIQAADRL